MAQREKNRCPGALGVFRYTLGSAARPCVDQACRRRATESGAPGLPPETSGLCQAEFLWLCADGLQGQRAQRAAFCLDVRCGEDRADQCNAVNSGPGELQQILLRDAADGDDRDVDCPADVLQGLMWEGVNIRLRC